jgi:(R)-2-hydroxyacyl-CoA dehydratese activating ATPase
MGRRPVSVRLAECGAGDPGRIDKAIGMNEIKNQKSPGRRSGGQYFCGVDVGASSTKVAVVNGDGLILGYDVRKSGIDYQAAARGGLEAALGKAGLGADVVTRTFSTGYGRRNVDFADDSRTEIGCHSAGCFFYFPRAVTVVDIGGQDNKIIRLDGKGGRLNFKMNRKCAAGTGAFLEEIAARLDLDINTLDGLARNAEKTVRLGSFCTVFSKTEILAHIRKGEPVGGIVKGAFLSVVQRVIEMDRLEGEVVLTGGVAAHNRIVQTLMSEALGREVLVPLLPQLTGAFGAALLAGEIDVIALAKKYMD